MTLTALSGFQVLRIVTGYQEIQIGESVNAEC